MGGGSYKCNPLNFSNSKLQTSKLKTLHSQLSWFHFGDLIGFIWGPLLVSFGDLVGFIWGPSSWFHLGTFGFIWGLADVAPYMNLGLNGQKIRVKRPEDEGCLGVPKRNSRGPQKKFSGFPKEILGVPKRNSWGSQKKFLESPK